MSIPESRSIPSPVAGEIPVSHASPSSSSEQMSTKIKTAVQGQIAKLQTQIIHFKEKIKTDILEAEHFKDLTPAQVETTNKLKRFLETVDTEIGNLTRTYSNTKDTQQAIKIVSSVLQNLENEVSWITKDKDIEIPHLWRDLTKQTENLARVRNLAELITAYKPLLNSSMETHMVRKARKASINLLDKMNKDPAANQIKELVPVLRNLNRLEKHLADGDPKAAKIIQDFVLSNAITLDPSHLSGTRSATMNPSYFVTPGAKQPKSMLFKPTLGTTAYEGIPPGEEFKRQLAAYLLDRQSQGKVHVPLSLVGKTEDTIGSLQVLEENIGDVLSLSAEDRNHLSVTDLQLQTLHRGRLYDLDGHLGNLLCNVNTEGELHLIPIDFDYILPVVNLEEGAKMKPLNIGWRFFSQMDLPFEPSVAAHIGSLDTEKEEEILRSLAFSPDSRQLLKATTQVFKMAVNMRLTPGETVDFLNTSFNLIFLENLKSAEKGEDGELVNQAAFEEILNRTLHEGLHIFSKNLEDNKKIVAESLANLSAAPVAGEIPEFTPSDKAQYNVKLLIEQTPPDFRDAIHIVKNMIKLHADKKDIHKAINHIKERSATDLTGTYAACLSVRDAFVLSNDKPEANILGKWMVDNMGSPELSL